MTRPRMRFLCLIAPWAFCGGACGSNEKEEPALPSCSTFSERECGESKLNADRGEGQACAPQYGSPFNQRSKDIFLGCYATSLCTPKLDEICAADPEEGDLYVFKDHCRIPSDWEVAECRDPRVVFSTDSTGGSSSDEMMTGEAGDGGLGGMSQGLGGSR